MQQLGGFIFRYRKWVIIFWLLVILIFGYMALRLPTVLGGNGFEFNGDYNKTRTILEKDFGQAKSTVILVFHRNKSISDPAWKSFINKTFAKLRGFDSAVQMTSPFENQGMLKHDYAYGIISFNKKAENLSKEVEQLRNRLKNRNGLNVTITGEPVIVHDLNVASQEDLAKAEMIGLPIALIVLILAFGGLVAAAIPLIIGLVSILTTMGIVYLFSFKFNLTIFILNIIPMIGLALSIDFALLFINRYKEELKIFPVEQAIKHTVETAGRSIIFSALCVFIGLSGLWFIKIDIFQNVALGGMTVVFMAALCALSFLPAVLSMLGKNVNKLSVLKITNARQSMWNRLAQFVMRKPLLMAISALVLLLIGLIPVRQMTLTIPSTDSLPPNYPSRTAIETYWNQFVPKDMRDEKQVTIVLETKGEVLQRANFSKVTRVIGRLDKDHLVHFVSSPYSATGIKNEEQLYQFLSYGNKQTTAPILNHFIRDNKLLIQVYLKTKDHSPASRQWVRDWSKINLDVKAHFGGPIKFEQEIFDEIYKKAPYGLLLIFVSTFIILMAAFRSLLIPFKALVMNMLSLGCTFGIVVWIFQQGHLGMKPVDIALILPVFVFTLVFGLSMDYEVFLISRIQEFYLKTGDNSKATISGLTLTSKIITSAAAIMIVVTGAFAFTGVMPIKQLGVGIAIAIFIDATIVRMVLVPALMKLLGDWNWWFFGVKVRAGADD